MMYLSIALALIVGIFLGFAVMIGLSYLEMQRLIICHKRELQDERARQEALNDLVHPPMFPRKPPTLPVVLIIAFCALSRPAAAQDPHQSIFTVAPYVVLVSGNVADIVTTSQCFNRGRCSEGNGGPLEGTRNIVPLTLTKGIFVGCLGYLMHSLETHGHPRIAKVIGYVDGGVTFAAAMHNTRVAR